MRIATLIDLPESRRGPRARSSAQDARLIYDGMPGPYCAWTVSRDCSASRTGCSRRSTGRKASTRRGRDAAADRLFPRLAALIIAFGGEATYGQRLGCRHLVRRRGRHGRLAHADVPAAAADDGHEDGAVVRESPRLTRHRRARPTGGFARRRHPVALDRRRRRQGGVVARGSRRSTPRGPELPGHEGGRPPQHVGRRGEGAGSPSRSCPASQAPPF